MSGDAPCYKCETRYGGCHANCLKYIDYTQQCAVEKEKIKTGKIVDSLNYNSFSNYPKKSLRKKRDKNIWRK